MHLYSVSVVSDNYHFIIFNQTSNMSCTQLLLQRWESDQQMEVFLGQALLKLICQMMVEFGEVFVEMNGVQKMLQQCVVNLAIREFLEHLFNRYLDQVCMCVWVCVSSFIYIFEFLQVMDFMSILMYNVLVQRMDSQIADTMRMISGHVINHTLAMLYAVMEHFQQSRYVYRMDTPLMKEGQRYSLQRYGVEFV